MYHIFLPGLHFPPLSIFPPLLHTHSSIYHPHCIISFSQHFSFPSQCHSPKAPYTYIHLPPTLYNIFLQALQFSPLCIIPTLLNSPSSIYTPICIIVFSQHFTLSCQYRSTIAPFPFIHLPPIFYIIYLPVLQLFPVSTRTPLLHTLSSIRNPQCIIFFPSTSVFHCQYLSTIAPYSFTHLPPKLYNIYLPALQISPVSIDPPFLHTLSTIFLPHTIKLFPPSTSVVPCQYRCTIAPFSFIHQPLTLCNIYLPALQFSLSLSFHYYSILFDLSTTHNA